MMPTLERSEGPGRDVERQWRPTVAIVGEVDESVSSRGYSQSGPARVWG